SVETSLFKTPAGSSSYQFRAICKVENDTIAYPVANFITDDPNNSYGTMNVAIHKLQAGTLTPGPTIDTAGISGDLTTRFHCLGDKLLYARVDQRTVPTWETVRGLGLALWDSANQSWVLENDTTNKSLLDDKYKKWHDDGARYVYEIWSAARLGDQYLLTIDGSSLDTRSLVSCVDSNSGPNPDTCTSVELTNLVSAVQNPYFRTPNLLAFPNGSGGVDVMLLSLEPYESSAKNRSWTFTAYDGQTFTTSCKGDDRTKPCHNVGEYPSTYEQVPLGESVGFRSMAGSSFNHIYVVGQPEFPIFDPDLEKTVTRQTPCDGANAGYTCVTGTCVGGYCEDGPSDRIGSIAFFDGANWSSLTVPSKVLLREAAGKLVGFYDYVFDQALYLASRQTLLLAGHYRACIHATDASKCFVAGETITLSGRAFLLAYDEATQTFSPMLPLGAARTADCCDGTQTDCGAKARCTRETIKALLSGFGAALGLVAPTPTSHELYVLENRYAPVMCSVSEDCGTNGFCYLGVCDDYQYKRMQPLFHSLLSSEP
ncbi:MAG: hypothetical protein KC609_25865, partial [Myxococcales bacterium]|nr:hypothetical protein [Myxococcales bacterium]